MPHRSARRLPSNGLGPMTLVFNIAPRRELRGPHWRVVAPGTYDRLHLTLETPGHTLLLNRRCHQPDAPLSQEDDSVRQLTAPRGMPGIPISKNIGLVEVSFLFGIFNAGGRAGRPPKQTEPPGAVPPVWHCPRQQAVGCGIVQAPSFGLDGRRDRQVEARSHLRRVMLRCRGSPAARRPIIRTASPLQADAPCRREADHSGGATRERLKPSVPEPGLLRVQRHRCVGMTGRPDRAGIRGCSCSSHSLEAHRSLGPSHRALPIMLHVAATL